MRGNLAGPLLARSSKLGMRSCILWHGVSKGWSHKTRWDSHPPTLASFCPSTARSATRTEVKPGLSAPAARPRHLHANLHLCPPAHPAAPCSPAATGSPLQMGLRVCSPQAPLIAPARLCGSRARMPGSASYVGAVEALGSGTRQLLLLWCWVLGAGCSAGRRAGAFRESALCGVWSLLFPRCML